MDKNKFSLWSYISLEMYSKLAFCSERHGRFPREKKKTSGYWKTPKVGRTLLSLSRRARYRVLKQLLNCFLIWDATFKYSPVGC